MTRHIKLIKISTIFTLYFLVLFSFTYITTHEKQTPQGNFLSLTTDNMIEYYGLGDPGNYALGGKTLATMPNFRNSWFISTWAPGMFTLHALIYKIDPLLPTIFIFAFLICLLWAGVFTQVFLLFEKKAKIMAFFVPMLFFYFDFFRNYYLSEGIPNSEPFSAPLFLMGIYFYVTADTSKRTLLFSGLCFALAAYMRAHFEFSLRLFTIFIVFIAAVSALKQYLKNNKNIKSIILSDWVKKGLFIALAFQLFTLPYRFYNTTFSWVKSDSHFKYNWMTDQEYNPYTFVRDGGGNTACHINPIQCQEFFERREFIKSHPESKPIYTKEYAKALITSFITQPFQWFAYKAPFMYKYWFFEGYSPENISNLLIFKNILLTIMLTFSLVVFLFITDFSFLFACFSCHLFTLIVTYILHIEARYFDVIKLVSIYLFIIAINLAMNTPYRGVFLKLNGHKK